MVLMLALLSGVAMAQNNTNSPYTRYGFGQLTDPGSANSKAMGGVAYGLRDKAEIASYQCFFIVLGFCHNVTLL